jgi:hypothetical protein
LLPRCMHRCSGRASPAGEAAASTRERARANAAVDGRHAAEAEHDVDALIVDNTLSAGREGGAEA